MQWIQRETCTACGACDNACPVQAIEMTEDQCGFRYPIIDEEKCIQCGRCKKVCPILKEIEQAHDFQKRVYAAWSKDGKTRFNSTSGGAFSEIARTVIAAGGAVAGAAYGSRFEVEHIVVWDEEGLLRLRQSKYVQSMSKNIFEQVERTLLCDAMVLFCGTPCQIAGLKSYLGKDYHNLLTVDFICRGVNSPKAYRAWLQEIELKNQKKVKTVWFKYKENCWKKSPKCTRIDFHDGSWKVYTDKKNSFMTGYLGPNLYIRPSCAQCKFKGSERQADITLADFWGIEKEYDDDNGTSLVIVNSEKGQKWFDKASVRMIVHEKKLEDIYAGNSCFNHSVTVSEKSRVFLMSLNQSNFSRQIRKYTHIPFGRRVLNKLKRCLSKTR